MTKSKNWVSLLLLTLAVGISGCGRNGSSDGSSSAPSAADATGPSDYHNRYSAIQHTNVTIKDFDLRTEDGQVIHIPTDFLQIDLQALSGFAQGLNIDLTNVDFPDSAASISVAEIQVTVINPSSANIQSSDGSTCTLSSVPSHLNFYTSQSITLSHDAYHVKIGYSPLNSIQLDEIQVTSSTQCCHHANANQALSPLHHQSHDSDDDDDNDDAANCSNGTATLKQVCELVNRRQPITSIARAVDDNF